MPVNSLKKVVVIGPESTGKSMLCELLAQHYNTVWCPEFAREYLLKHGMNYSYDDLLKIAKGQVDLEEKFEEEVGNGSSSGAEANSANKSELLIIDTDMYVMKVWCEFVFGKCHQWIIDQIAERKYDLYLLCNIDLPWSKDELREYPDAKTRLKLYHMYRDIMINQTVPWIEISGNYDQRLGKSVEAINRTVFGSN